MRTILSRLDHRLARILPEQRLFLRSDTTTSYIRLRPLTQALTLTSVSVFVIWSLVASTVLIVQSIGAGDLRAASLREQTYFQQRVDELAEERDRSAEQAQAAQFRYGEAMDRVSSMQSSLLVAERHRAELERGIEALQSSLRERTAERDAARARLADSEGNALTARLSTTEARLAEVEGTFGFLIAALGDTAEAHETVAALADEASRQVQHLALEYRMLQDRNDRIFSQLEEAVQTSMAPLERMFRAAGLRPEDLLRSIRSGYQNRTAALQPISISTSGTLGPDSDVARANSVLQALDEINMYRIAAQRTPFAMPVRAGVRHTSSFGTRRDPRTGRARMHNGVDWAGPRGTPIHATAGGTVTHAGRQSGYGNLVIIQHDFGLETYYAHLHTIGVSAGQRVSRGDRIGGMGTTGRSTGVHLHYEIRASGRPINPMNYIRAAQNVF